MADVLGSLSSHRRDYSKSIEEEFQAHIRKLDVHTCGLVSNETTTLAGATTSIKQMGETGELKADDRKKSSAIQPIRNLYPVWGKREQSTMLRLGTRARTAVKKIGEW